MRSGSGGVLVCGVVCDGESPRRVLDVSRLTCTHRAARRRPIGWCRYAETMRATSRMCGVGCWVEVAARLERVLPRFSSSSFTMIVSPASPASPTCRCRPPSFRVLYAGDPQFPFWDEDDFVSRFVFVVSLTTEGVWGLIFGRRSGAPLPLSIFIRSNSFIWSSPPLHFAFDIFPCHPSCPLSECRYLTVSASSYRLLRSSFLLFDRFIITFFLILFSRPQFVQRSPPAHTLPLQCPPSVETSSLLTALLRKLFVQ
jgi:hypothetical protein